jgi:multidrug efflux pump subunit AcrB
MLVEHMEFMEKKILEVEQEQKRIDGQGFLKFVNLWGFGNVGYLFLELDPQESRKVKVEEVMDRWRESVGVLPGTKALAFSNVEGGGPEFFPISLTLTGNDRKALRGAAEEVLAELTQYKGVFDIRSDIGDSRNELHIALKPEADRLGLKLSDVGNQVRHAFYGYEAQRIQRGNDEIKVLVRYPEHDRKNLATLRYMPIRTENGSYVPFSSVASGKILPSAVELVRVDGSPAIDITADADDKVISARDVVTKLTDKFKPRLAQKYRVDIAASASSESEQDLMTFLLLGFVLALFANYVFIAMPLRSYAQPAIVMAAIPFCMIGAILGHYFADLPLSMLSLFGVIAASGVVVNDGLILADFINKARATGKKTIDAVIDAGSERFRAIMLTSLTTFFGLLPIMLENSAQARFVVPMAVSLSYGVLFATVVTLFLLPCMYMAVHDIERYFKRDRSSQSALATQ